MNASRFASSETSPTMVALPPAHVIEIGAELPESVEPALLRAPVETVRPVTGQRPQIPEVGALTPRLTGRGIRPPGLRDSCAQIGEDVVGNVDRERFNTHGLRSSAHRVSARYVPPPVHLAILPCRPVAAWIFPSARRADPKIIRCDGGRRRPSDV